MKSIFIEFLTANLSTEKSVFNYIILTRDDIKIKSKKNSNFEKRWHTDGQNRFESKKNRMILTATFNIDDKAKLNCC